MRIVVDNSAGGDSELAKEVARRLEGRGLEVELRAPPPSAKYDTSVHLLSAGIVIRVSDPDRAVLAGVEDGVRAALLQHSSVRRRTRSVPVHLGETERVLEWIDVFD
jgi:hypothetical protein